MPFCCVKMTSSATATIHGYTRQPTDVERRRAQARIAPPNSREVSPSPRNADLPRSASYTYLSNIKDERYANPSLATIKRNFTKADLIGPGNDVADITPPDSSGWNTPDEGLPEQKGVQARDLIVELQKNPSVTAGRGPKIAEDGKSSVASSMITQRKSFESSKTVSTIASTAPTTPRTRASVASNFSRNLNRRSWIGPTPSTPSRSPSPSKKENNVTPHEVAVDAPPRTPDTVITKRKKSLIRRQSWKPAKESKSGNESSQPSDDQSERPVKRGSSILRKKVARPTSGLFKSSIIKDDAARGSDKSSRPAVPALPKSFSTDKLPMIRTQQLSPVGAAPMPRLLSSERTTSSGLILPRKKDDLWNVFRALDGDFAKFASKSVAFKANVVRSSLLPFLRSYATHPANRTVRPEDLDRRANILNKWWTGLMEMLHGRNNQSISGTDRPVILDGISGIMERPEWRLPPSPFCPLNLRTKGTSTPRNRSTTSLTSNSSDFLTESVHHNVRNTFIQNLSAQMAFVVDKMSLRNASASLVTFCGKACAYAFMFVPGMADVLARLWDLQTDPLRRVLEGNGIGKFDNLSDVANTIVPSFPPALSQLGFSSLMKYMRKLRTPPPLPLGTANVQWWGRWLDRWTGQESDLFYVFVKYFHILTTDFLPSDSSKKERMCAPGVLLVHAQILTNLDATIHRDAKQTQQDPATVGSSPTFDDVFADPDAVASALPLLPTNAVRLMAENRLVMLIRDFLSERAAEHPLSRRLFAESFNDLLQTATRGTSMFDHAACYTLLDFLEEALRLLVRFEHLDHTEGTLIDFDFWKNVWRKMVDSQNTMTEIRLYTFLYTVWNTVICDLGKKTEVCFGLLLDPEIFESRFNHWCPMVRAYFMRLLCWRLARHDGESSNGDPAILETMLQRLQDTWSSYLYLREQSEQRRALPPPTNPCNPAPSRRLLIIRTDTQINPVGAFLSYEGVGPPKTPTSKSPTTPTPLEIKRSSTMSTISAISQFSTLDVKLDTSRSNSDSEAEPRGRGIGGFFRNLVGSKNRSKSRSAARSRTRKDSSPGPEHPGIVRSATEDLQVPRQRESANHSPARPTQPTQQHRNFSFKFSLEYHPNTKPLLPIRLLPPRLPLPAQQLLQSHSEKANVTNAVRAVEPFGASRAHARYCGRALAEWAVVLGECQSFFDRRRNEGVPGNKFVETPTLGVEVFRRPA